DVLWARHGFHGLERVGQGLGIGRESLSELDGTRRIEVPLHPCDMVERAKKRRQQGADRLDGLCGQRIVSRGQCRYTSDGTSRMRASVAQVKTSQIMSRIMKALMAKPTRGRKAGSDPAIDRLRAICLALPETTEKVAWGEPTFRVRGKLFAQLDN